MEAGGGAAKPEDHKPDNVQKSNQNHHHRHFFRQATRVAMFVGVVLVMLFVLYRSAYSFEVFPRWSSSSFLDFSSSSMDKRERSKLNGVLKKAAMGDKTVILTTLNEGWAAPNSVFDVFLESFKIGNGTKRLLNHLVVVTLDQKAYKRCLGLHPHCYFLKTSGKNFSGVAVFMSAEYLDMMWRRILFLQSVLELGYNFVFTIAKDTPQDARPYGRRIPMRSEERVLFSHSTVHMDSDDAQDTDIMWFRDPFPRFYPDADFQIACDYFFGDPSLMMNNPNGGFNYVKSNNHTIKFYKFWYTSRLAYPQLHDQDVLNRIKVDPILGEIGVTIKFLDTQYFGGFCQPSQDLNKVCTMHANCCVGLHKKIHDLKAMLEDWRKFLALPDNVKASQPTSWTVPDKCSLEKDDIP